MIDRLAALADIVPPAAVTTTPPTATRMLLSWPLLTAALLVLLALAWRLGPLLRVLLELAWLRRALRRGAAVDAIAARAQRLGRRCRLEPAVMDALTTLRWSPQSGAVSLDALLLHWQGLLQQRIRQSMLGQRR